MFEKIVIFYKKRTKSHFLGINFADVESEELDPDEDEMLNDAILCVAQHETASVSLLQRKLRVGYTRAGRLVDMLERRGVVTGYEGSKARRVLVSYDEAQRMVGRETLSS